MELGLQEKPFWRMPLLVLGMVSLMAGLWAGLGKIEWVPTGEFSVFPSLHGALMVAGFLGNPYLL